LLSKPSIQQNAQIADKTVGAQLAKDIVINEFNSEHQFILGALVEDILGIDAEGTITLCNDALSRMIGYSKEEIVGENAHDLPHHSRVDGSRYPREECDLTKAIVGGRPRQMVGGPTQRTLRI
jgi:PAS domain-containing protein